MVHKVERYLMSKKFEKAMSKVGADSIPFNNSTPTEAIEQILADAAKEKSAAGAKCASQN
jgi:hypothetical protein